MGAVSVTIEVSEEQLLQLDKLAAARNIHRADAVREALEDYCAAEHELQADLDEADRQIENGETVAHEDVVAWFEGRYVGVSETEAA